MGDLAAPGRPLVILHSLEGSEFWITVPEGEAAGPGRSTSPSKWPWTAASITARLAGSDHGEWCPWPMPPPTACPCASPWPAIPCWRAATAGPGCPWASGPGWAFPGRPSTSSGGLSLVCVVDEQGLARSRAVTLGETRDGRVEVLSGLAAGQRVVSPLEQLIPEGTPIRQGGGAAE
jgi:hypothetical protein